MNRNEISRLITALPDISSINPMQRAMLSEEAPAVTLIAPTGSGKTLAFCARMLTVVERDIEGLQAIVIAPSRELVIQTAEVLRSLKTGLKITPCYGGHSMREEIASLTGGTPAIIVATPGRLLDHLQRGSLATANSLNALVLDEYDKSLELGFADEMRRIVNRITLPKQVTLTSATPMADKFPTYLKGLRTATIDFTPASAAPRHRMDIVRIESPSRDKLGTLIDLLRTLPSGKAIVFVNHRENAERVYEAVRRANLPATLYHGAMSQDERETAVDLLASGVSPIMIATDLAARGLDISELSHIIHYHLPISAEVWTHRNGRTARQDASGTIYTITSEADNIADFITFDRSWTPKPNDSEAAPIDSGLAAVRFDAGRKEKISRGDIVGFITANTSIAGNEIGRIALHDHYAIVALPRSKAADVEKAATQNRIKGKKIRAMLLRHFS